MGPIILFLLLKSINVVKNVYSGSVDIYASASSDLSRRISFEFDLPAGDDRSSRE